MRGAEDVIEHACKRLGVKPGQTTADGRFTLYHRRVPGLLRHRAVLMVNDAYHENMTLEKLDALIAGLS